MLNVSPCRPMLCKCAGCDRRSHRRCGNDAGTDCQRVWLAASVAMLLTLLFSAAYLIYRKRPLERGTIAGAPVYITEHAGPASSAYSVLASSFRAGYKTPR